jgi:hypothetical protein
MKTLNHVKTTWKCYTASGTYHRGICVYCWDYRSVWGRSYVVGRGYLASAAMVHRRSYDCVAHGDILFVFIKIINILIFGSLYNI